jgi:hypothetical protein
MAEYRGRRPADASGTILPTGPSRLKAPVWPLGDPSDAELGLWRDLWRRPVATLWRNRYTPPLVVARYVRVLVANPASGSLAQMESGLGLTPASLGRLHVSFEAPRPPLGAAAEKRLADAAAKAGEP